MKKITNRILVGAIVLLSFLPKGPQADTTTSRWGLTKPDIGSSNWGPKLNTNADTIDNAAGVNMANTFTSSQTFQARVVVSTAVRVTSQAYPALELWQGTTQYWSMYFNTGDSSQDLNFEKDGNIGSIKSMFTLKRSGTHVLVATGGDNVLSLENTQNGFVSAVNFLDLNGKEKGALGRGNPGASAPFGGQNYWESSNFGDNSVAPDDIVIVTTMYGAFTPSGAHVRMRFAENGNITLNRLSDDTTAFLLANGGAVSFQGTTTNDNALTGFVGEYFSTATANPGYSSTGTSQWFDIASRAVTAGDWEANGIVCNVLNGATETAFVGGISTTSGNSSTGLVDGDNWVEAAPGTSNNGSCAIIPGSRFSLSGSATIYLKAKCVFTVGTPKAYGRLALRRIR